jgi:hypothetical protein
MKTPKFLLNIAVWLHAALVSTKRHLRSNARVYRDRPDSSITDERLIKLCNRQDAREQAKLDAVITGYCAKIDRVRAGKGKNTLTGIPRQFIPSDMFAA